MMWSPQQYIDDGLAKGIELELLERAAQQIEDIIEHPGRPALLTLGHLAQRTGVSYLELRRTVESDRSEAYRYFRIRKRSGGHRLISVPKPSLLYAQRWIANHVLNPVPVHRCSFAFKPGSSIYKCASLHARAKWLVKMDLSGFFGSISEIQVFQVFRNLGYSPLMSFELARLTTHAPGGSKRYSNAIWRASEHDSPIHKYALPFVGFLPQGAPTSPMLSNLVMRELDAAIQSIATNHGLRYTRYSDDLTFSTRKYFSRKEGKKLISEVTAALASKGLSLNPKKTVIAPPGGRKVVLGLFVDGPRVALSNDFRSSLRQHLYYLERFGPEAHAAARGFDSVWGLYRHIKGKIDFANMVDQHYAAPLYAMFFKLSWPSHASPDENQSDDTAGMHRIAESP